MCALLELAFLICDWHGKAIVSGYAGVIFGLLVAHAHFFPDAPIALFGFFRMKVKYAVLLMAAVEMYLTISPEGGIAHAAPLVGALAAWCILKLEHKHSTDKRAFPDRTAISKRASRAKLDIPHQL